MIELKVVQGSQEWLMARLGIPTGSQFSRVVTPGGKPSAQREEYMAELLAAYFIGEPDSESEAMTEWIERGKAMEPQARDAYSLITDAEPRLVGLCYPDESRSIGDSPDWMIDPDGVGEVKCPMARTHLINLARGGAPGKYWPQIQGHLFVTGREWCDFVSYYPGLPIHIARIEPDAKYQAALGKYLPEFVAELAAAKARLIERGVPDPWAEPPGEEEEIAEARASMEEMGFLKG